MADSDGRYVCQNVDEDKKNIMSSFKVEKSSQYYPANGEWIQIASNQLEVTFEYGFSETSDVSDTATMQDTLSTEMKTGIIFEEVTISAEVALEVSETVEQTYELTGMVSITTSCAESPYEDDPAVGFFIWKVLTSDSLASSVSPVGICRYGSGEWNVAPACPLAACIGYRCNDCKDWKEPA